MIQFKDNRTVGYLQTALDNANGQIQTLKEWNDTLRAECNELRSIIYKRFGLVIEQSSNTRFMETDAPSRSQTWRTVRSTLENAHNHPQANILSEQQKYWEKKLADQEKTEGNANIQEKTGTGGSESV